MSYDNQAWAARCRTGNGTLKAILQNLAVHADEDGMCWPSHERLAWALELTDRTIRDGLKKLEAMGFISRQERRRADGTRKTDLIWLQIHRKDLPMQEPPKFQRGIRPPDINRKELPVEPNNRNLAANQPENDDTINRKDVPGNYQKKNYQENPSSLRSEGARESKPTGTNVVCIGTARAKANKTAIPEDFEMTPAFVELLTTKGYSDEEIRDEWDNFKDHHNACGNTFKRPELAARKWARNCRQPRSRQAAYGRGGQAPATVFHATQRFIARVQAARGSDGGHEVDLPF